MLTKTGALSLYTDLTNNAETRNQTTGLIYINQGIRLLLGSMEWPFLERSFVQDSVAGQQVYNIPVPVKKVVAVSVKIGTYTYTPSQVFSQDDWNFLNTPTDVTGDVTSYYFVKDNQVYLWPKPATSGNEITINALTQVRDISKDDYVTGTVSAVANGGTTITGSGTTWTAGMVGSYISITNTNAANVGDGFWYQITDVPSTTSLTISRPYAGTSIVAGAATYTIGDVMIIPQDYQLAPVYYAAAMYWRAQGDQGRSVDYMNTFEMTKAQMHGDEGLRTTSPSVDDGFNDMYPVNPNLLPKFTP